MKRRDFFRNIGLGTAAAVIPAKVLSMAEKYIDSPEESWPEEVTLDVGDMILFLPDRHPFHLTGRKKMDLVPVMITDIKDGILTMGPCEDITPNIFKGSMDFVKSNAVYMQPRA